MSNSTVTAIILSLSIVIALVTIYFTFISDRDTTPEKH